MGAFEKIIIVRGEYDPGEYADKSYYSLLIQLPYELGKKHITIVEDKDLNDTDALNYFTEIVNRRQEAVTITVISDTGLREIIGDTEKSFLREIETSVFESPDIGAGQTARVKRFALPTDQGVTQMAIKYLLTPNKRTLSAAGEHDMIHEVERIETIEAIERQADVNLIRVPHPYFHHKSNHIQCYGMELVDGITLQEIIDNTANSEIREKLRVSLAHVSESALLKEVERFFQHMHTYCLHGDIKPLNIMVNTAGTFYIIDFGQSVLVDSIPDSGRAQLDNLKEDELAQTKYAMKVFLRKLFQKN